MWFIIGSAEGFGFVTAEFKKQECKFPGPDFRSLLDVFAERSLKVTVIENMAQSSIHSK